MKAKKIISWIVVLCVVLAVGAVFASVVSAEDSTEDVYTTTGLSKNLQQMARNN